MLQARTNRSRSGATAIEMAAVISIFCLLLFGIMEYCLILYVHQVTENASREGARYLVVNSANANAVNNTKAVVLNFMGGLDTRLTNYSCQVYMADASGNNIGAASAAKFGEYVCVDVSVDYVPLTPGLTFLSTFTIRHKCAMGSESN